MAANSGMERVREALLAAGVSPDIRELDDSTATAADAAAALDVDRAQIAKTLVFLVDDRPVVVIMSGTHRVDERALAVVAEGTVRRADADRVRSETGFAIGGVSPAGLPPEVRVFVDRSLRGLGSIWAAAGSPRAVYETGWEGLLRVTGGTEVSVAAS